MDFPGYPGYQRNDRCRETVYVRDTYRRTGRGKTGFEMHYIEQQCSRKAGPDGYCFQHPFSRAYKDRSGKWRKFQR